MSAWTKIAHTEVGSGGAANITFSSIPQTYTDLLVKISLRSDQAGFIFDDIAVQFNGDTGANYSGTFLRVRDATVDSGFDVNPTTSITVYSSTSADATASTFGSGEIYIPNYSGGAAKSVSIDGVSENNATNIQSGINAGLWNSNNAITGIKIFSLNSWNFVQYSSATLYGITKGSSGGVVSSSTPVISVVSGGTLSSDSTYYYRTFTSNGTLSVSEEPLSADVLVVAGGGGGGEDQAGGGGAGGLLYFETNLIALGSHDIVIGAGGAAMSSNHTSGSSGSNSSFGLLTAAIGGGRGAGYYFSAENGGSGGGGSGNRGPGSGTSGQGYDGASGPGGGGGARGVGTSGVGGSGGPGADEFSSFASATSTGSEGIYAAGGRANNGVYVPGLSGPINSGNGGGGSYFNPAGDGGSGVVIVRYLKSAVGG